MVEKKPQKQTMRFSDEELSLIKNTFAERDDLLFSLRKNFLQLEREEKDDKTLYKLMTPEIVAILWKMFLPTLEGGLPLGQEIDLWMTINFEGKTTEEAEMLIAARKIVIDYLDQQLNILEGGSNMETIFKDFDLSSYKELIARNTIIAHVEMQLQILGNLAGFKNETPEETKERLKKNSTK